jgi:SulP family sulfate permease
LAIWLALYSGLFQLLLGVFRMGSIANLVSQPVVTGFINAAAVIIMLSQLPQLLGIAFHPQQWAASAELLTLSRGTPITAAFGCSAILLLVLLRRYAPRLPGVLLVTVLGILASRLVDYVGHGGVIVGDLPSSLPTLALPPAISFDSHRELWTAVIC